VAWFTAIRAYAADDSGPRLHLGALPADVLVDDDDVVGLNVVFSSGTRSMTTTLVDVNDLLVHVGDFGRPRW
jgi:hypothetical protein